MMSMRPLFALVLPLVSTALLLMASPTVAETVGWRTDGDGRYPDARPPSAWSPTENVVWKTPMESWSNASPVLIDDRSLVVVLNEPDTVLALDAETGEVRWQDSLGDLVREEVKAHKANGWTTATPTSDGRHLFTVLGTGLVVAHDLDGRRLWHRDLQTPEHRWGHSASPLLVGGRLVVHVIDLIGLDPKTGDEVWRIESAPKWGSPIAVTVADTEIVLTPSGDAVRAKDGHRLASGIGNLEYAAPVVHDGIVYFIEKKATAVRLPETPDGVYETLWTRRVDGSRHYASVVIHEGLIYAISREQKFSIVDTATGEVLDTRTLDLDDGSGSNSAYPSLTLAGDHIYVGAQNGTVVVLAPGRSYDEVSRHQVEGFRSTPVFDGSRMILRAFDHVYCFGADDAGPTSDA